MAVQWSLARPTRPRRVRLDRKIPDAHLRIRCRIVLKIAEGMSGAVRAASARVRSDRGPAPGYAAGVRGPAAKRSAQRMRPVSCITTNSVRMAPTVTVRPVTPSKKKAYENSTR